MAARRRRGLSARQKRVAADRARRRSPSRERLPSPSPAPVARIAARALPAPIDLIRTFLTAEESSAGGRAEGPPSATWRP